jgi:hypothetical protein
MQQTDILASQPITSSGAFQNQAGNNIGRGRIRAIYIIPTGTAGSVVFKDGGASGTTLLTINTVASATVQQYIRLPANGLLFQTSLYGALTNVGSVVVFYA